MEQDLSFSGAAEETGRHALRVSRDKKEISERKSDRSSKELGVHARSYYEDPDYDILRETAQYTGTSNLKAPEYPGYEQRWISLKRDNGAHLIRMLEHGGWSLRDPKTVPVTSGLNTSKWGEYDAIVAGNELVLCCMRKEFYAEKQRKMEVEQRRKTQDVSSLGRDLYGATAQYQQYASVYNPEFNETKA